MMYSETPIAFLLLGVLVVAIPVILFLKFVYKGKKVEPTHTPPGPPELVTRFKVVENQIDVHPKKATIEIKMKSGETYLSYVVQELITHYMKANLTKGYLTNSSTYSTYRKPYREHDGNFQDVLKYSVDPIEKMVAGHMFNATGSIDHMAHFIDKNGFRFQLDRADILHIKVKKIEKLKVTVPTVEITLEPLEGEIK